MNTIPDKRNMKYIVTLVILLSSFNLAAESELMRLMRFSCQKSKSARACYNYANLLHRRQQNKEAKKYFKLGCRKGYQPSCNQVLSDKLINATFVKSKYKPKKVTNFEKTVYESYKNDEELNEILNLYCDQKKIKTACQMKKCLITDPFSQSCEESRNNKDAWKSMGVELSKVMKEIQKRDEEKLASMEPQDRTMYLLQESVKLGMTRLAKECDNGNIESCFSYEYAQYLQEKQKEIISKMEDMKSAMNRSKASQ